VTIAGCFDGGNRTWSLPAYRPLYLVVIPATVGGMAEAAPVDITATLLAHRNRFKAFLASRVGNEADAEDLLQNGLVKAFERSGEIKDDEKAVAWFYRVLRNVVVDHARSRHSAARRDDLWALDTLTLADDAEARRQICGCFEKLLPTLKPMHAQLLRRVELQGESVSNAALQLGITANNASVTLHRARAELRTKLVGFCGDCSCLTACECED
jgi:RNA polymerase sigma-70 factor (ECF subfamily)